MKNDLLKPMVQRAATVAVLTQCDFHYQLGEKKFMLNKVKKKSYIYILNRK